MEPAIGRVMRIKTILFSFFMITGAVAGCQVEDASETRAETEETVPARGPRRALGKADQTGSCSLVAYDGNGVMTNTSFCGGKSEGTCWCDDKCSNYGDCCGDYSEACTEPVSNCPEGEVECASCCGNTLCAADMNSCPHIMCPAYCPPPKCEDFGGSCLSDPNDVTFGASCSALGLSDGIGSCDAFNQTCCGAPLPAPSCVGNCGGSAEGKACFCDSACTGYGDCCGDYEAACN
jgi:hypothetical protein